ncbi:MAG: M20/M25/M40 family metallo-hydrolase [Planctomycetes bacterium]|nr:M20/M25/M40 family metallo-hydrolase [Planctomycetota bacterium]
MKKRHFSIVLLIAPAFFVVAQTASAQDPASRPKTAASQPAIAPLPAEYKAIVERIAVHTQAGTDGYRKLSELCDTIGNRLSGSANLERAVEWAVATLKKDGHENVRTDPVEVVKWVRGRESLEMIEPRPTKLHMLGLGGSVATPPEGITAEVLAVPNQDALQELGERARGKIVLFDVPMPVENAERGAGYGTSARYRVMGARWASELGAAAVLVRSATTHSLRTPHTGAMNYFDAKARIPAASVTVEDAAMISRLQAAGHTVRVTLKMEARTEEKLAPSANVIAELRGRERPDEIVVIGGHLDSWDVGQGAQDDGAGCIMAMEALNVLRKLDLQPRRTIRVVLFTNEENGLAGGKAYAAKYADALSMHAAAIESDSGGGAFRGYSASVKDESERPACLARLEQVAGLLGPAGSVNAELGGGGADISPMGPAGVPMLGHRVDMTHYFDIHHTEADTVDKIDPRELDKNIAGLAATAYILADMPGRLGEPDWRRNR